MQELHRELTRNIELGLQPNGQPQPNTRSNTQTSVSKNSNMKTLEKKICQSIMINKSKGLNKKLDKDQNNPSSRANNNNQLDSSQSKSFNPSNETQSTILISNTHAHPKLNASKSTNFQVSNDSEVNRNKLKKHLSLRVQTSNLSYAHRQLIEQLSRQGNFSSKKPLEMTDSNMTEFLNDWKRTIQSQQLSLESQYETINTVLNSIRMKSLAHHNQVFGDDGQSEYTTGDNVTIVENTKTHPVHKLTIDPHVTEENESSDHISPIEANTLPRINESKPKLTSKNSMPVKSSIPLKDIPPMKEITLPSLNLKNEHKIPATSNPISLNNFPSKNPEEPEVATTNLSNSLKTAIDLKVIDPTEVLTAEQVLKRLEQIKETQPPEENRNNIVWRSIIPSGKTLNGPNNKPESSDDHQINSDGQDFNLKPPS